MHVDSEDAVFNDRVEDQHDPTFQPEIDSDQESITTFADDVTKQNSQLDENYRNRNNGSVSRKRRSSTINDSTIEPSIITSFVDDATIQTSQLDENYRNRNNSRGSKTRKSNTNNDNTSEPSIITSDVHNTSNPLLGDGEVNIQSDVSEIDVEKKNLLKFITIIKSSNKDDSIKSWSSHQITQKSCEIIKELQLNSKNANSFSNGFILSGQVEFLKFV
jgi:hypothetical protein